MIHAILVSIIALSVFLTNTALAATRYVATTGSDANSCAASEDPSTPKLTLAAGVACMTAGDILYVRGGTYASQRISVVGKTGTSLAPYTISGFAGETAIVATVSTGATSGTNRNLLVSASQYITIENMVLDGVNTILSPSLADPTGPVSISNTIEFSSNIVINNVEFKNHRGSGFYVSNSGFTLRNSRIHDSVSECVGGSRWYGVYYHEGSNGLIENNEIYNMPGGGMQLYTAPLTNVIVRGNWVHDSPTCTTSNVGAVLAWASSGNFTGLKIYNNLFEDIGVVSTTHTASIIDLGPVSSSFTLTGAEVYNNTLYAAEDGYGVSIRARSSGAKVRNNLITGSSAGAIDDLGVSTTKSFNACTAAENCGTDKTTIATILDCTNADFTLKNGGSCNTAGTPISGYPYNGANPPIGAFYPFTYSSATINEAFLDVTLGMNLNLPVQPTAAGWSVGCSGGVNCGTPVVSVGTKLTGTDNVVRLTLTGLGGTGVCEIGQTWTVSYNAATGATTDSALIGGTLNQELSTFTTQAVVNKCAAAPPAEPGTPLVIYELDESSGTTADNTGSSGAADDGTLTGSPTPQWVSGKHGNGVHFTDQADTYIAIPYGSGVNPTTQSLTVCLGVLFDSGITSSQRIVFSADNGTNQRFYIGGITGTWGIGVQSSGFTTGSEFTVTSTWTRTCLVANSGTDVATLYVNGVKGTSAFTVKSYTSYTFSTDFVVGKGTFSINYGGTTVDKVKIWTEALSDADITADYENWEPPSPPPTGTRSQVAHQFQGALLVNGAVVPMAAVNANATVAPNSYFAYERQVDCTVAACSSIGEKLYYSCALCPSAGAWTILPDILGPDQIAYSGSDLSNILSGSVNCCLSGALTENDGSTQHTSAAVPVYALAQNASITNTSVLRTGASTVGWEYCIKAYNQTTLPLDSYTPSGGGCITVVTPSASVASLPKQPTGLTVTPNPTQVQRLLVGLQAHAVRSSW